MKFSMEVGYKHAYKLFIISHASPSADPRIEL
jgi:hypothetical protein